MKITLTGTAPLLTHNIRLADDLDPLVREMKTISSKRSKTDDDRLELSRLEFLGGLYYTEGFGVYMPAENIFRSIMNAAKINKGGKTVERGLIIEGSRFPLIYDGPTTPEDLWGDGTGPFVDRRAVNIMGKRIMRTRPIFEKWAVEFSATVDPQVLDEEEFMRFLSNAGQMEGLGDYRRFFGKFTAEVAA